MDSEEYSTYISGVFFVKETPSGIKNVIFNPPATIVFWEDGSKTVVKCQECPCVDCSPCSTLVAWRVDGMMHAMLKHLKPGYLNELRRFV